MKLLKFQRREESKADTTELRSFDLLGTESLSHLTVREFFERLENGEIESQPVN